MNALLKVLFLTFGSGCHPLRIGLRGMGDALHILVAGVQLVSKILNIKVANLCAGCSDKGAMDYIDDPSFRNQKRLNNDVRRMQFVKYFGVAHQILTLVD